MSQSSMLATMPWSLPNFLFNVIFPIIIIIIIIIISLFWDFFTPALANGLSLEFKWQQVSRTLLSIRS